MSVLHTLARAEAVAAGRAVAAATVRHVHLGRPLVLVPLTTAGEAGAPLGAMVGTDRAAPTLLVVPQPLDRELRFGFFAGLASVLLPALESYGDAVEVEPATRNREETELCADALQIVVPNSAGLEYVRLVGRSTRFLRTVEDPDAPHPVPVPVPLLGRWLTHYAERARTPGSGLLLAMTDLLTRHWATGQSAMEDQHLGALLGWIDPPPGLDGPAAAARAQTGRAPDGLLLSPPAGPATDPVFDNRVLAPALARYDKARPAELRAAAAHHEARTAGRPRTEQAGAHARHRAAVAETAAAEADIRELVASQLRPTWDDVWHGLELLRALPEGAHVEERWKRDRWSFTGHRDRVRAGEPPQPKRDDAITAAQKLAGRETAQARLTAQESLDDPLAMAARRLSGEAFTGTVVAVEMTWSEGRRPMPRPLLTLTTADLPQAEPGTKAYRALPSARSAQSAELIRVEPAEAGTEGLAWAGTEGSAEPAGGGTAEPARAGAAVPEQTGAAVREPVGTTTAAGGPAIPTQAGTAVSARSGAARPAQGGHAAGPGGEADRGGPAWLESSAEGGDGDRGHVGDGPGPVPGNPGAFPGTPARKGPPARGGDDGRGEVRGGRTPGPNPDPDPGPGQPDAGTPAGSPTWSVTVKLTGGMGSGRTPKEGSVPAPGDAVTFTLFEHDPRGGPALPEAEQTPWTHGGPPGSGGAPDAPDPVTTEDFL